MILILYRSNYPDTDTIPILKGSKNPDTDTIPILHGNGMIPCMIPKKWILGYFKLFIAIIPFQNDHSSDVFGAKTPLILKLIPLS